MEKGLKLLIMVLVVSVFAACVPAKEYRAKLTEAEELRDRVGTLEGQLEAEKNLRKEEVSRLSEENELFKQKNEDLIAANTELSGQMEADRIDLVKEITGLKKDINTGEIERKDLEYRLEEAQTQLQQQDRLLQEREAELDVLREEKRKAIEARKEAVSSLKGTYDELVSELNEEIQKGRIAVSQLQGKLTLNLVDKILFDSGQAEVNKEGRAVLDRVADVLRKVEDKQVRIEGHTDNVGISSRLKERFPTNWELSAARATNVVRYLQEQGGLDPALLSAAGYSEYRPVALNDSPENKAKNRRIEIVLVPVEGEKTESEVEEPVDIQSESDTQ